MAIYIEGRGLLLAGDEALSPTNQKTINTSHGTNFLFQLNKDVDLLVDNKKFIKSLEKKNLRHDNIGKMTHLFILFLNFLYTSNIK